MTPLMGQTALKTVSSHQDTTMLRVYLFHTRKKCMTCRRIEKWTKQLLESEYAAQLENGIIVYQPVNVAEKKNEHFIHDYSLITKAIVLSRVVNGREQAWKNLDQIWTMAFNKQKLWDYIRNEILLIHQ
jgi:hypothetical protein